MSVATVPIKLADVAELNPRLPVALDDNELVSFLPMAAVTAETARTTLGEERNYIDVRKGYTPFLRGDVLLAKITPCFENGKIAQATIAHEVGFGSTEFHVVRPHADKADARYLMHFLRQPNIRLDGERKMTGSGGQRRVPEHFLAGLQMQLPQLPEQRRIAEVLDRADALRAKRRAALAQLDSLTQSIFLDMFGDPKVNEKKWNKAEIGSVISAFRGGANLGPDDFFDHGFPILHKGAIKPSGVIEVDGKKKTYAAEEFARAHFRCQVDRGCLVVTLRDLVPAGPNIGLVADLKNGPFDAYLLAQGAYGFLPVPDKLVAEYFVYLSNMPNFRHVLRQNAVGSTQIHIRTPIYLSIHIPLPPVDLQQTFAHRITIIEKLKATQRTALTELNTLFASLQHRAFRGEL